MKLPAMLFPIALSIGILLLQPAAFAQVATDDHAAHHPDTTVAADKKSPEQVPPAKMQRMQENMKRMRELMTTIQASKDPAERAALMQQHMKAMREQMQAMHGMMGQGSGMGMGMMAKGKQETGGNKGPMMMSEDMMKHHEMMMQRMDMMQGMMEQMMERQAVQQSAPPAK